MNVDFETLLLRGVAPRLAGAGYVYDPRLRLDDELYGFRKELGAEVQAIIQFRYRTESAQNDFTINLFTTRSGEIQPRLYGGYPGARGARLSYVLWFVHGLRDYAVPDYWWVVLDAAYLPAALEEALGYIERYGIPWLEEAQASKPWEMPLQRAGEFAEAVQAVMKTKLERLGYRLERQSLSGDLPYCYFSKALPDGTYGLIELQAIYSLDPSEFNFDVRLQRKGDPDPLTFSGDYRHWRSISLAQLVWQARGTPPFEALSVTEVMTLFWHYRDRAELDVQLSDALEQIERLGCTWIEQAVGQR
ncbi:hypothetical protein TFLX_02956 [Thermoflexales bacterium]|nr:hypothetical protein TFLX_02956 [Thermoflexales bacterium]